MFVGPVWGWARCTDEAPKILLWYIKQLIHLAKTDIELIIAAYLNAINTLLACSFDVYSV